MPQKNSNLRNLKVSAGKKAPTTGRECRKKKRRENERYNRGDSPFGDEHNIGDSHTFESNNEEKKKKHPKSSKAELRRRQETQKVPR